LKVNVLEKSMKQIEKGKSDLKELESQMRDVGADDHDQHLDDIQNRISRAILLLRTFINDFEGTKLATATPADEDSAVELIIVNKIKATEGPTDLKLTRPILSTTVAMLCEEIAASVHPKQDANILQLTFQGGKLGLDSTKTLAEMGVKLKSENV